jgi:hypothetical protein
MDRRSDNRPASRDRRSFPRPPLWLNLTLLAIALVTFLYARHQRDEVLRKSQILFKHSDTPAEMNRIRDELAKMDVTKEELGRQIDARMQLAEAVKSEQFYLAVDTSRKRMQLRLGKQIVREMPVEPGVAKTIAGSKGKSWTFVPLKGAFNVEGKEIGAPWKVPAWVYAMNGQPVPDERPVVPDGLGHYVIVLPNGYVIHSPPAPDSPLKGPKPGSFLVPDADLAAIWPRITTETRVYIF